MAITFQLGKSGIDDNFIETIKTSFKKHDVIKIKVLKTHSRDKDEIKKTAESLAQKLETENRRYKHRIIGFTIIINKFRKSKISKLSGN